MNVYVVCRNFYLYESKSINVGGIETYILNLIPLLNDLGEVTIIQQSDNDFDVKWGECSIIGVKTVHLKEKRKNVLLVKTAERLAANLDEDLLLFADDQIVTTSCFRKSMAIQHGISWDVPKYNVGERFDSLFIFWRAYHANKIIRRIKKVNKLICVDYNFLSWYRTQVPNIRPIDVITNFTQIASEQNRKPENVKNIIFARRFQWYRGTAIMIDVTKKLLADYSNVQVTFAGSGPEYKSIANNFENEERVRILQYKSEDSLLIHCDQHIAVIPTIGSEGTSLSLLEAMASSCAVVCSNVGGMTNIVLDNYNGLITNPNADDIYCAIKKYLDDERYREFVAKNAYNSVLKSFSKEKWKEKWQTVLDGFKEIN